MTNTRSEGIFGEPLAERARLSRRVWLQSAGWRSAGLGALASGWGLEQLAAHWLMAGERAAANRLHAAEPAAGRSLGSPEVAAIRGAGQARNVICLHMGGGVSHIDTFDPKPAILKYAGQDVPESVAARVPKNSPRLRLNNLYPCPFEFQNYGECGLPVSKLFEKTAAHADELCVIRSMHHDSPIHTPADYLTLTGSLTGTRPSLGAWLIYGLGSENQNLPGFVAMVTGENYSGPALYAAGFLPAEYQATVVQGGSAIPNLQLPDGISTEDRRRQLDLIGELNRKHLATQGPHSELAARIASYELAFRMQMSAPEAFDLSTETAATLEMYGQRTAAEQVGRNCLLARRLVERGVRYIQLIVGGWDAHGDLKGNHLSQAALVDQPIAALLTDLKQRGLLDNTLVVWGGEFGRTPTVEGDPNKPGRDHNPAAYTVWLAGGGVRGGQIIGASDDFGYSAIERPIHPNDLHATILAALGIDQHQLYFEHQNRREIVTVNGGQIVPEVFG